MKNLIFILAALSFSAFAQQKKIILKVKDVSEKRMQAEVLKFYKDLVSKDQSVKNIRTSIVEKINKEEGQEAVSLNEVEVQSYLNTATSYEVNGNSGNDLKCDVTYEQSKSLVVFELKRYKRTEEIAFGARFNVTETSCVDEDESKSMRPDDAVVLQIDYLDLVDVNQTIKEL